MRRSTLLVTAAPLALAARPALTQTPGLLAQVAAGPVYRLLGARDLGFNLHTGPHTATPAAWATFVDVLARYFPSNTLAAAR
ncbi:MAG: hypothetical protein ABI634_13625 [Acidobacteriota bacterium]